MVCLVVIDILFASFSASWGATLVLDLRGSLVLSGIFL